jgi:hypothetical protein
MKSIFVLMSVLFFASACGEQFQGRFEGTLMADVEGCGNTFNDEVQIALDVVINGDTINLNIASVTSNEDILRQTFQGSRITTQLSGNSIFKYRSDLDNASASAEGVFRSMEGSIDNSRTKISGFKAVSKPTASSNCTYVLEPQGGFQLILAQ